MPCSADLHPSMCNLAGCALTIWLPISCRQLMTASTAAACMCIHLEVVMQPLQYCCFAGCEELQVYCSMSTTAFDPACNGYSR